MLHCVLVHGLESHVTEADLLEFCKQAGNVVSIQLEKDNLGIPKGFAYAEFATQAEAQHAIQTLNGKLLKGSIHPRITTVKS